MNKSYKIYLDACCLNRPFDDQQQGYDVLMQSLGVTDTIRFIQYFSLGKGDYTKERQQWLGQTSLEEVLTEMKKTPETDPDQYEEIIE